MKNKKIARLMCIGLAASSLVMPMSAANAAEAAPVDVVAQQQEEGIVPYGSLSGYGQRTASSSGSFKVPVKGSWSPWAGCTIRSEGFDSETVIEVHVNDEAGNEKAKGTLQGNMEIANLAMVNVSPGEYEVHYVMTSPSYGTVIVQIY